jgi:hypothetical protein
LGISSPEENRGDNIADSEVTGVADDEILRMFQMALQSLGPNSALGTDDS